VKKLLIKISAFTKHFPLKRQGSFKVLSLACSVLWKYCIFAHNRCKLRQIHVKMLISMCPTLYLQRLQHQWSHTLTGPSSYLNFAQVCHAKPFQSTKHTARYVPVQIYQTFSFERMMYGKSNTSFRCEWASFQVRGTPNSILWKNPALSKANAR